LSICGNIRDLAPRLEEIFNLEKNPSALPVSLDEHLECFYFKKIIFMIIITNACRNFPTASPSE
jgi:hypothetical protein